MKQLLMLTIFAAGCLQCNSQPIKTYLAGVSGDSSHIYLELDSAGKFNYYDCRSNSCYLWGAAWGTCLIHDDTLTLYYQRLVLSERPGTILQPAKYTATDGKVYTITNAITIQELRKYLISKNKLIFINDHNSNTISNWGMFDFIEDK